MRSFSGLYFILRGVMVASHELQLTQLTENSWFFRTLLFSTTALVLSYIQPYKKWYMNLIDTLLLSLLAFLCFMVIIHINSGSKSINVHLLSFAIQAAASCQYSTGNIHGLWSLLCSKLITFKAHISISDKAHISS